MYSIPVTVAAVRGTIKYCQTAQRREYGASDEEIETGLVGTGEKASHEGSAGAPCAPAQRAGKQPTDRNTYCMGLVFFGFES